MGYESITDTSDALIEAIKAETALIVADTNELQVDDVPGLIAALDAVVDTVKAETALIVADTGTDGVILGTKTDAAKREQGENNVIEKTITAASNAGVTTVATITTQPCIIKRIIVFANAAQHANLTTAAIKGGASQVVEFIGIADATQANLNAADKQVAWSGAARFAAADTIVVDLQGTGTGAVNLTVSIEFAAAVDGGYLV
tara:strand:+ start:2362 stop:2970 length:609 start_codon:yes stop_codon:yes gene_type:complete